MGFRGIDTANPRRHYFQAGVGEGLRAEGGQDQHLASRDLAISADEVGALESLAG